MTNFMDLEKQNFEMEITIKITILMVYSMGKENIYGIIRKNIPDFGKKAKERYTVVYKRR